MELAQLRQAALAIYSVAHWTPDRPVNDKLLWEALRGALHLPRGTAPTPIEPRKTS